MYQCTRTQHKHHPHTPTAAVITHTHQRRPNSINTPHKRHETTACRQARTRQRTRRLTHRRAVVQTKQNRRHLEVGLGRGDLLLLLGDLGIEVRSRHRLQLLDLSTAMLTACIRRPHSTQLLQRSSGQLVAQNASTHSDMHAHRTRCTNKHLGFLGVVAEVQVGGGARGLELGLRVLLQTVGCQTQSVSRSGQRTPECRSHKLSAHRRPGLLSGLTRGFLPRPSGRVGVY